MQWKRKQSDKSAHISISTPLFDEMKPDYKFIRMISRDPSDNSSTGKLNINRIGEKGSYFQDWFHTLAAFSTGKLILVIFMAYLFSIIMWAAIYYSVRIQGFIDIDSFVAALFFSMETMTTIGYTVTDITFGGHWLAWFLVTGQALQGIIMSSFSIGLVYTRLSRGRTRAVTILFSDNAILQKIKNEWYFMIQVCDRRKHQVLHPTIHLYTIQHSYNEETQLRYQSTYLNNNFSSNNIPLFLALPCIVSHHITKESPLYPNEVPENTEITAEDILYHMRSKQLEIIVLLDCAEPVTSNNFQARISYIDSEIKPNCVFAPCVGHSDKYNCICIDLERFQKLIQLNKDDIEIKTN